MPLKLEKEPSPGFGTLSLNDDTGVAGAGSGAEAEAARLRAQLATLDAQRQDLDRRLRVQLAAGPGGPVGIAAEPDSSIVHGIYVGERAASPDRQLDILRRVAAQGTRGMVLRGVDHGLQGGFGIARLYIPLSTDLTLPEAVAERLLKDSAGGATVRFPAPDEAAERIPDRDRSRALSAVETICLRRSVAVLGEPGSGKSTLLAYVAHALATRARSALPSWPPNEWPAIPVLLRLRDFAAWIVRQGSATQAGDALLWDFIRHDLVERNLVFCLDALRSAVTDGRAVMFWDGLDEIPPPALTLVRDSLLRFREKAPKCRYVVTCRVLAYNQPGWRLPERDFPPVSLAPFDRERIDRFAADWFAELAAFGHCFVTEADRQTQAFRVELKRGQGSRLAGNPLHLTLMALVYTQRRAVPEARAELFEEAIELLYARMDGARPDGEAGPNEQRIGDLLREARRDRCDLIALCERLAMAAQRKWETGPEAADPGGLLPSGIGEPELLEGILGLHPGRNPDWAQSVLEQIKLRPGLLREEQSGFYDFPHRALREYLAGCHMAHSPGFPQQAAALADDRSYWREPILHGVGFLIHCQREMSRPIDLVERLCAAESNLDDTAWRRVWLAGEVTLEIGYSRVGDSDVGTRALERARHRLAALVESGRLLPGERVAAGVVLGRLGDPRFEPRGFHLPARYRGEREKSLGLVAVQHGRFVMGSPAPGEGVLPNELGNDRPIELDYPFWISRYPVTVAQYRAFVKGHGYERRELWTPLGWTWVQGQGRRYPEDWASQRVEPNRPVVGVNWLEAFAYGRWLDVNLRKRKTQIPDGYGLRLPTEAEWELAARGLQGRLYPWGGNYRDTNANCQGLVGGPCAVGIFPGGATPEGVHDLAGNVWEWTLSQDRPYPYNPHDGRNRPDDDAARILRGGSHDAGPSRARGVARARAGMRETGRDIGFRLVLSLSDSAV